jgi:hypothetical protein
MEAQLDLLEGKTRTLTRFRDRLRSIGEALAVEGFVPLARLGDGAAAGATGPLPAAMTRAILTAQEDLRREIARAMHDGPAQSLTNIALQAQIVQRLVDRDPARAGAEVVLLIEMVQRTLEATKTFIFDVRPMVLDDLGLVPTLRRAVRDRAARAHVTAEFESIGADRRLDVDVESGVFRILDDALESLLQAGAAYVKVQLDWDDAELRARIETDDVADEAIDATRAAAGDGTSDPAAADWPAADQAVADREPAARPRAARGAGRPRLFGRGARAAQEVDEVPVALEAMMRDQREGEEAATVAAADAVREARAVRPDVWTRIEERARTLGVDVALTDDGRGLELRLDLAA